MDNSLLLLAENKINELFKFLIDYEYIFTRPKILGEDRIKIILMNGEIN